MTSNSFELDLQEKIKHLNAIQEQLCFSKIRLYHYLSSLFDDKIISKLTSKSIEINLVNYKASFNITYSIINNTNFTYKEIKLINEGNLTLNDSIRLGALYGDFAKNFHNISFLLEKKLLAINILLKRIKYCEKAILKIEKKIFQENFEENAIDLINFVEDGTFLLNEESSLSEEFTIFVKSILGNTWNKLSFQGFFNFKRKTVDLIIYRNNKFEKERIKRDDALCLLGSGMLERKTYTIDEIID